MMLKYGGAEDSANVVALFRKLLNKDNEIEENKENNDSLSHTTTIPFTVVTHETETPLAHQLGQDTGDVVGNNGLAWSHRACKLVYDSEECNESENCFTVADVVAKVNGRVSLKDATEAADFLMIESHISTTQEDHHYKSTIYF